MRTAVDFSSSSKKNYINFCTEYPSIKLSYDEWKKVVYGFTDALKEYILETGEKVKLPHGFGEFSINKKKRKKVKDFPGKTYINLPIDWQKTKEKGKVIYNFNYHTEGYFFGWVWFKETSRIKHTQFWYFKPSRVTSRLLAHYLKINDKYQHIYREYQK
jgi:nucleoid DNA-binding protein